MTGSSTLLRTLLIYSLCLPLAIFVGYLIASPDPVRDYSTYIGIGLVLFLLMLPLLLRWHRVLLLATWNATITLYFVPARPEVFFAVAWFSLTVSVIQFIINPRAKFISIPTVTKPLIVLAVVVIFTACVNGGIGFAALGSETQGGKKYFLMLTGIAAWFALISQPIPPAKAYLYVGLFFLGSLTQVIGDLGPILFPSMPFLFWLFPLSGQSVQMLLNNPGGSEGIARFGGAYAAAQSVYFFMLARYGIRGIFNSRHPLRFVFFVSTILASLLGGFRGDVVMISFTFAILFYCEGLVHSRLLPIMLLGGALFGSLLFGYADRLPLNFQRAFTVVPGLRVNEQARLSAEASSDWRLDMWRQVLPEVPKYLLLGKGFAITAAEMRENLSGGPNEPLSFSGEGSAKAGDFHNGPLSLIIPFGIWGTIAFIWFLMAAIRVLYRNYKYGPPYLQNINTFLFTLFLAKTLFFFLVFGSSNSDLSLFCGLIGLSVALNSGVAAPSVALAQQPRPQPIRFRPKTPRPIAAV